VTRALYPFLFFFALTRTAARLSALWRKCLLKSEGGGGGGGGGEALFGGREVDDWRFDCGWMGIR